MAPLKSWIKLAAMTALFVSLGVGCAETKYSQKPQSRNGAKKEGAAGTSSADGSSGTLKFNGASKLTIDSNLIVESAILGFSNLKADVFTTNLNLTVTINNQKKTLTFKNDFGSDSKTGSVYYAYSSSWQPELTTESTFRAGYNSVCISSGATKCNEYVAVILFYYPDSSGTTKFMSLGVGVKSGQTAASSQVSASNPAFDSLAQQFGYNSSAFTSATTTAATNATSTDFSAKPAAADTLPDNAADSSESNAEKPKAEPSDSADLSE